MQSTRIVFATWICLQALTSIRLVLAELESIDPDPGDDLSQDDDE